MTARRYSRAEIALLAFVFLVCLVGAAVLPMDQCPDEEGRSLLARWIVSTGTLPTGDEPEVMIRGWGFSYALRPYLSSMISAVFVRLGSLISSGARFLRLCARLTSVLSVTGCGYFCLRLGHSLFRRRSSALLLAATVCALPQVLFLGMYENCDALSLCAVSAMLAFAAEGQNNAWEMRTCAALSLAFSAALLSYYSVYGWILAVGVFFLVCASTDGRIEDKLRFFARRIALMACVCLLLAGWFFLRNAWLHGGDPFGMAAEGRSREAMRAQGVSLYDYGSARADGVSLLRFLRRDRFYWLKITVRSFFGMFGYMDLPMPRTVYRLYYALTGLGFVWFLAVLLRQKPKLREMPLFLTMTAGCAITFLLHLWQSYARDFQPQGRYIITLSLWLGYMFAFAADRTGGEERSASAPALVLTGAWIGAFFAALPAMLRMLSR